MWPLESIGLERAAVCSPAENYGDQLICPQRLQP